MILSRTVKEDTCSFSHAFSQPPWPPFLKVKFPSRHRLSCNNMTREMFLDGVCHTNLKVPSLSVHSGDSCHVLACHVDSHTAVSPTLNP